jgi:VTC domain
MDWLVQPFAPIGLDALNKKAAMLERLDNKYVVRADVLQAAVHTLAEHFEVLEIEGQRAFTYDTCYFDDASRRSFKDHQQGRRQRMKVRVRRYLDAHLCFVEVKLKDKRGITVKKRMVYEEDKYGMLDDRAVAHVQHCYEQQYGRPFSGALEPVIEMRYQRVTLVAKQGGERMTIDTRLNFIRGEQQHAAGDDVFIVETKSANGHGLADSILKRWHQHPTNGCSKYCVGMSVLGVVNQFNRFMPALRKLGALDAARQLQTQARAA